MHQFMEDLIFKYFPNLSKEQREQFKMLFPLYKDWNSKINLISRADIDNLYEHHVLHSLAIAKFFEDEKIIQTVPSDSGESATDKSHGNNYTSTYSLNIMDVGTGGGFPSVPISILYECLEVYPIDSIRKKVKVIEDITQELKLENLHPINDRVENISEKFDFVTARAVASLDVILKGLAILAGQCPSTGKSFKRSRIILPYSRTTFGRISFT